MVLEKIGDWELLQVEEKDINTTPKLHPESTYEFKFTKEIFNNCPFKSYILQDQEVLFIVLSGSALNGLIDCFSDYDLVVIVKKPYRPKINYNLKYNNRLVHWHYWTITQLYSFSRGSIVKFWGTYEYKFLTYEKILYINSNYTTSVKVFLSSKELLANIGLYEIYKRSKSLINDFINSSTANLDGLFLKFYHIIAYSYLSANNRIIDMDFLLRVKRMRYFPLSDIELNKLILILKDCLAYLPKEEWLDGKLQEMRQEYKEIWAINNIKLE